MKHIVKFIPICIRCSIRTKLATLITLLIAGIAAFIYVYVPMKVEEQAISSIGAKAQSIVGMTAFSLGPALFFDDNKTVEEAIGSAKWNDDLAYIVVANDSNRIVASFYRDDSEVKSFYQRVEQHQVSDDGKIFQVSSPVVLDGKVIGHLYLGLSLDTLHEELLESRTAIAIISLVIFVLGMLSVIGMSSMMTKPLRQMVETAQHIAKGDLTKRADVTTSDEVSHLAQSFNIMVESIEANTKELRREIASRIKAQETIREQAALIDITRDAIIVHDLYDQIVFWNNGAEQLYGWTTEEACGKHAQELLIDEDSKSYEEARKQVLETGEWVGEINHITKTSGKIIVESRWTLMLGKNGKPKAILVTNTDITEKKQLETQFLRSQRMQSVGTLASGIAHDLNNVLAPIVMAVQILRKKYPTDADQKLLEILESSANRGAGIIKQVLSFARGFEGQRTPLQVKHLVKEFEKVIGDTFPKSIQIRTKLVKDPWMISGDLTQLYQVLMNLCVNARDAMLDGGVLQIEVENVVLDEHYVKLHVDAKQGPFIRITVTDTGMGISPAVIDKIFEPFFTTKDFGKGTGLGLSTVIGIVKSHGGFVNVYSEIGKGTKFRVYLPSIETSESQRMRETQTEIPKGHGELVLVVDDESAIREVQKSTLEANGYRVVTANDGTDAVARFVQHTEKFKLVITDMMMPFMDGASTIRALKKLDPVMKFVAVSGLMGDDKTMGLAPDGSIVFLQKPYSTEKLLQTIEVVLNSN